MKKLLLLFIGLILPVLVFVFLRSFGRNEFHVPPLHQEKIEGSTGNCNVDYNVPYVVHDSILSTLTGSANIELVAISTAPEERHLKQLIANYKSDLKLIERDEFLSLDSARWIETCILIMQKNTSVVLLDTTGRIRGYYDASDREELDRLDAEIKIILKKYEEL